MHLGATFPSTVLGRGSRDDIDTWVASIVELGFDHIALSDHVVGIDPGRLTAAERDEWAKHWLGPEGTSPLDHTEVFVEPFTMGGYLAARCDLELITASLVLPQRQTALVAKQAEELDHLTDGRVRLCVGSGWSGLEFRALGADFGARGAMLDEQIEVLRRFWTQEVVDYQGQFHDIRSASLQSLPRQRPIPIWAAGDRRRALERTGRLADGWLPQMSVSPTGNAADCLAAIRASALEVGRDPDAIGLEPTVFPARLSDDEITEFVSAWRRFGPTHLLVNTGRDKEMALDDHLLQLKRTLRLLDVV